jgi:hypothetical protein
MHCRARGHAVKEGWGWEMGDGWVSTGVTYKIGCTPQQHQTMLGPGKDWGMHGALHSLPLRGFRPEISNTLVADANGLRTIEGEQTGGPRT